MQIRDVIELAADEPGNFFIYFGNFLDEFYSATNQERSEMVRDEPRWPEEIPAYKMAFLAGAVEKLCLDHDIEVPDWVGKDKYVLRDPYFALNAKGDLRMVLLVESPPEFKARNIFVSENCLERV